MSIRSTSSFFRLIIIVGYGWMFQCSDCIELTAVYGKGNVEFTCVISPYTGSQRWFLDSVEVSFCGAKGCNNVFSNPRYSFMQDLTAGSFIFKIYSINATDDKRVVGCYNGTLTETLAITFQDKDLNHSSISNNSNLPVKNISTTVRDDSKPASCWDSTCLIITIVVVVVVVLVLISYCAYWCCLKATWKLFKENTKAKYKTRKTICVPTWCLKMACLVLPVCGCIKFFFKKLKVERDKPTEFTYDKKSVTNNRFTVLWNSNLEKKSKSNNDYFLVWYSDKRKVGEDTISCNGKAKMEYEIMDLEASTNYTVKLQTLIGDKRSAFTKPLKIQTLEALDKPEEFNVVTTCITSKSVLLRWKQGQKRGTGHTFVLIWIWKRDRDNENKEQKKIQHDGRDVMQYKLGGLLEATIYTVKLYAEYNDMVSEYADTQSFETKYSKLTLFRNTHQRIAGEKEICCGNCKKTRGSHASASQGYCLSHELYLCFTCLDKEYKNEECVLLWKTDDIEENDHKLCCYENCKHDDLQLGGVCKTCDLFICFQCIKTHNQKHVECTSHQQLHGSLNSRTQMCCERIKTTGGRTTVDFCLQCKTFICATCSNYHETHIFVSSLTYAMAREPKFCCERNNKARGNESDDFCVVCNTFICASCLKKHDDHVVISSLTGLISTRAGMCCDSKRNKKIKDFCIKCQKFLCSPCKKNHIEHILVSSLMATPVNDVFCKGCARGKSLPIECLTVPEGVFLCASCYETGNLSKALREKNEFQRSSIRQLLNKQNPCQVHKVLGTVENSLVEVYCIICKLYMCRGCFKKHRRIYEYWSKTFEGNSFYCNCCPPGQLNPVECCDFTSLEFKCGKCYIVDKSDTQMAYTKEVKKEMKNLRNKNKHCQVHEDETTSPDADVICLVCKTTMCKSCFEKHINLEKEKEIQQ